MVRDVSPNVREHYAAERAAIDASTRLPVLVFFASSVVWLIIGTLFGLAPAIKFHTPDFLADSAWLTFGRLRMAHLNTVAYGWATMAGIAVMLWLMARLSRTTLRHPMTLVFAAVVWNVGLGAGIAGILMGMGTSVEWLELPAYTPPVLAFALLLVISSVFATFARRTETHLYVTQWYLLGACIWLPWLYVLATVFCIYAPAPGVVQGATNWWFAHNVLGLWLTPVGVGAAYYIIPKVIGRPIYSYYLSILGFWALALFYSWAGIHHLIGGPYPAWLVSASVVGSVMMIIPVLAVALNHHMTLSGNFRILRSSPSLRFVVFGAMAYTAVSFQGSLEALRAFNRHVHFTHYTVAHAHLGVYGFFSMVMFGCTYYIVPRLTGREWASAWLIRWHFWLSAIGIALYFVALTVGGWKQGQELNGSTTPVVELTQITIPYLWARTAGGTLMALGHLAFACVFVMNLMGMGRREVQR